MDISALEFIVFLRPVKSRILWVQMVGRGTRKCPEINKTKFTVFDCFDGALIEYFKNTTDFEIQPPIKTHVPRRGSPLMSGPNSPSTFPKVAAPEAAQT